jgi:hypothetical protein
MALVEFGDGHKMIAQPEYATKIWEVLNGERDGTEEEQEYCAGVKQISLDWRIAPDSYVELHFATIVQIHFSDWMVDVQGHPTRPDPSHIQAMAFAKKWGLYAHGQPTKKALDLLVVYNQPRWRS